MIDGILDATEYIPFSASPQKTQQHSIRGIIYPPGNAICNQRSTHSLPFLLVSFLYRFFKIDVSNNICSNNQIDRLK